MRTSPKYISGLQNPVRGGTTAEERKTMGETTEITAARITEITEMRAAKSED